MRLRVFGSGSQGNALAVRSGKTLLLLDCGFTCRELEKRMAACDVRADDVTAVLFTHDHTQPTQESTVAIFTTFRADDIEESCLVI